MTVKLTPYLVMDGNAKEAIQFYEKAFAAPLYIGRRDTGLANKYDPLQQPLHLLSESYLSCSMRRSLGSMSPICTFCGTTMLKTSTACSLLWPDIQMCNMLQYEKKNVE